MQVSDYSIASIFKKNKLKISLTFVLLLFENAFKVIQPFMLGIAINDLLVNKYNGLMYFTLIYFISFVIGLLRRFYDTRTYTYIYTELATDLTGNQYKNDVSITNISARSSLVKELIDFFEQDITQGFSSLIQVVGALIMLFIFNKWIFLASILTILLIVLLYFFSNTKIFNFNVELNNEFEKRLDVLKSRNIGKVRSHFKNISKWMIKLSDLEMVNFGIIEIILLALALFTLTVAASTPNISAGSIFSIMTYILEFSQGIFMLPFLYQQFIRLKEISIRLKNI